MNTTELSTASAGEAFTYGMVDNVPFPPRILALIKEAANREYIKDLYGNPCFGPMEDGNGDPMQDDADASLAWIEARSAAPGRAPLTDSDLPTHPEPHSFAWTDMEKRAILKWGNSLSGIAPAGGIGGE